MLDPAVLRQMTEFHAVPGNEEGFANWLVEQLAPHADRVEIDKRGNVIARKGSPQVALFAHLDSPGFIVQQVEPGAVKLAMLGHPSTPTNTPLVVETPRGLREGLLVVDQEDLFLEFGDPAQAIGVQVGDAVAFAPNFSRQGEFITSRFLDNKVGCWIGLEAFKEAESMIFAATVCEEGAPDGAGAVAGGLDVEMAIVLDVTYADSVGCPYPIRFDGGPAITLLDRMIHDRRWAKRMRQVADEQNIPYQIEVVTEGGSDTLPIARAGLPTTFLGVPTRYAHSPHEVTHLADSHRTLALVLAFLHAMA